MSCFVLDIELADKHFFIELGVFFYVNLQGYSFLPPKKYKPIKQGFWCTRNLHGIVWNTGCFVYRELANNLPRAVKDECFPKGSEKCKVFVQFNG